MIAPDQVKIIAEHQKRAPIDISRLAIALGLSVYKDYHLPVGISGMISIDRTLESQCVYAISVNGNESYFRQRFTIAHECAHFLLHRDRIGDGISDDAMYRSVTMNNQEEFDANNTAADLLMPRSLVLSRIREGFGNVSLLAREFQVSVPAMQARLRFLYRFA